MRNVKLLWTVICLLLICVLYLLFQTAFASSESRNENNKPAGEKGTGTNRVVAKIGDYSITHNHLQQQMEKRYGKEALAHMIEHEVIAQEATDLGLKVSSSEIRDELERLQQGYDSEAEFYKSMKEQLGLSRDDVRKDVYYKLMLDKIATNHIEITDQTVDDYLKDHPEELQSQTQLHLQQIVLGTRQEAKQAIDQLLNGADFAELAKQKSMDETTADDGGDLGWVGLDDPFVMAEVLRAAQQLQPGEISAAIPVEGAYAVVKLLERKDPTEYDKAKLRESIRKELALNEALPVKEVVEQLKKKRKVQIVDPKFK